MASNVTSSPPIPVRSLVQIHLIPGELDGYRPSSDNISFNRCKEILKHASQDLGGIHVDSNTTVSYKVVTDQKEIKPLNVKYNFVVFDRQIEKEEPFPKDLRESLANIKKNDKPYYAVHIIRKKNDLYEKVINTMGVNYKGNDKDLDSWAGAFFFYVPQAGQPSVSSYKLEFAACLRDVFHDRKITQLCEKLRGQELFHKLVSSTTPSTTPGEPTPGEEWSCLKKVALITGILTGVALVASLVFAAVFFGAPIIAAAAAGTFVSAMAGKLLIGSLIATTLFGLMFGGSCFFANKA